MKTIQTRIGLYAAMVLFAACSESTAPAPANFYHVFTGQSQKTWVITNLQWTGKGESPINYNLNACFADDQYIFYANTDRHYQVTNGTRKCNNEEPDLLIDDTWSFVNATATLTIVFPLLSDNALPFFVRSVNESKMELEIFIDQDNRYSYRITLGAVTGK